MSWTIDFTGNSGSGYRYWNIDLRVETLQSVPGNYAFLKQTASNSYIPLYFGQADNLSDRLRNHERWPDAVRAGATVIVAHTTPAGESARLSEERDLIVRWNPPLNVHHRTTG
jgi:hypothetical protein